MEGAQAVGLQKSSVGAMDLEKTNKLKERLAPLPREAADVELIRADGTFRDVPLAP
jgi:hypothetical protein